MTFQRGPLSLVRIGSACSGYGGLDLGLITYLGGGEVAWHVEYDKHPSAVLDARFPGVPNYGDVTKTDWTRVEPVDWFTAGYPCQPFSHAGKRRGSKDERHLWPAIAHAISVLRPGNVLLENVAGHVSLGLDTVTADLAAMGYVGRYGVVRACDAGAPHARERVFIVASDARRGSLPRPSAARDGLRLAPECGNRAAADPCSERHGRGQNGRSLGRVDSPNAGEARERERSRAVAGDRSAAAPANAESNGWDEGRPEPTGIVRRLDAAIVCRADCSVDQSWRTADGRDYGPALRRWHDLTRCVPQPTVEWRGGRRLNPQLNEWMMGLPAGWVTDILARNPALKALGNGVVPQQCALALSVLLPAVEVAA